MPKYKLVRLFEDDPRFPTLSADVQERIFNLIERVNQPEFVAEGNEHAVIYGIQLALLQLGYELWEEGEAVEDQSGEVATAETGAKESTADARAAKGEG